MHTAAVATITKAAAAAQLMMTVRSMEDEDDEGDLIGAAVMWGDDMDGVVD